MDRDENYWSKLPDYAEGRLSDVEASEVQRWLSTNEDAQSVVNGLEQIKSEFPDEKARDAYYQKELNTTLTRVNSKATPTALQYVAAAAILLVGGFLALFLRHNQAEPSLKDLLSQYSAEFYSAPFNSRGDSSQVLDWIKTYQSKDFESTAEALALRSSSQDPRETFYLGMAYFYSGEFQRAFSQFSYVSLEGSVFEEQSSWYAALALLNLNETERARILLNQISRDKTFKFNEAQQLLEVL